jgi:transcriptional regulator of acetoin/glycerol metabolism
MQSLLKYRWPGNVRELANVIERAQILAEDNIITLDDLPEVMLTPPPVAPVPSQDSLNLAEVEKRTVQIALQRGKENKVHTARLLGISRRALYRLLTKYGLDTH